eukprot:12142340-Prorocentrum_lima.AAC.1
MSLPLPCPSEAKNYTLELPCPWPLLSLPAGWPPAATLIHRCPKLGSWMHPICAQVLEPCGFSS